MPRTCSIGAWAPSPSSLCAYSTRPSSRTYSPPICRVLSALGGVMNLYFSNRGLNSSDFLSLMVCGGQGAQSLIHQASKVGNMYYYIAT